MKEEEEKKLPENKIDIEQLKTISSDFTKRTKDEFKSWIIIVTIATIIIFFIFLIIANLSKGNANYELINKDLVGSLIVIFILLIGLVAYLNIFIQSRKNNGRSSITIKVNQDSSYVDNKMRELLKYLRYKEKKYKGGTAFYAYKDRYSFNTESKKRYIAYTVNDGELTIEAWAYELGREFPIDKNRFLSPSKTSLAYDLEFIAININK